jgi:hypothetical protein
MKDKLLSGKFLFTVITALVFAYCAITGKLPQDKITEVILLVVYAYFNKPTNINGGQAK